MAAIRLHATDGLETEPVKVPLHHTLIESREHERAAVWRKRSLCTGEVFAWEIDALPQPCDEVHRSADE